MEMISATCLRNQLFACRATDGINGTPSSTPPLLALIDIREPGEFGTGHLLMASNIPLSRLELLIPERIKHLNVPIVLCAGQNDIRRLRKAASILENSMGYQNVKILSDDQLGCEQAGFVIFTGFNVPSKAFGEWLEIERHTPCISAQDLASRLKSAQPPYVFDCRPAAEHARGAVPGAINLPGVELGRYAESICIDSSRPIVVHCAGRTRGIVAAQSLRDLGYNHVLSLENGLMAWQLAGFSLAETVADAPLALSDGYALDASPERVSIAMAFANHHGVHHVDWDEAQELLSDPSHSAYGFSVGTQEEFLANPPMGFQHVTGGQLIQALDDFVVIHGARIVIHANDAVRACMTSAYLRQMGWCHVYWVTGVPDAKLCVPSTKNTGVGDQDRDWEVTGPQGWLHDEGTLVIDLGSSARYRQYHLPNAKFGVRALIDPLATEVQTARRILLSCDDGRLSHLARIDLLPHVSCPVFVLAGGVSKWKDAGHIVDQHEQWLTAPLDVALTPYDYQGDIAKQMQEYIDWELALVGMVHQDGLLHFQG